MKKDVIGKRFGRLTVLRHKGESRPDRYHVICACDCGKEWTGYLYNLLNGDTTSCGCYNIECVKTRKYEPRHKDLTGKVFGELKAIKRNGIASSRSAKWLCRCSCGVEKDISAHALSNGLTISCGHIQKEIARETMTKHGRYKDKDYIRELGDKRRAMKTNAFVEHVDPSVVYDRDMGLCQICGLPVEHGDFNMDHRVPLFRGGKHSYDNCQTAHASCNFRKSIKTKDECTHLWRRS